jgi:hypothetical protein
MEDLFRIDFMLNIFVYFNVYTGSLKMALFICSPTNTLLILAKNAQMIASNRAP